MHGVCIYMHPVIYGRFIFVHPIVSIYSYSNNSLIETEYRLFYLKTTVTFMVYCLYSLCLFVVVLCRGFQQATYHSVMTNGVELWSTETEVGEVWYGSNSLFLVCRAYCLSKWRICSMQTFHVLYLINYVCSVRPPLWSSSQSFCLLTQRSRVRFPALPDLSE
jgi:hypothetical protein